MAIKKTSKENVNLIDSFKDFKENKHIDKPSDFCWCKTVHSGKRDRA